MIMARRLTLEGAKVKCVLEALPYLTGLRRNYVQCLEDFGIPLHLSTTIRAIQGARRVEAVETVQVDATLNALPGTETIIPCDTVLLSVGLIPENELSRQAGVQMDGRTQGPLVDERMETSLPGIFAAGNVVAIYDLVDFVSKAGMTAGREAAHFARSRAAALGSVPVALNPGPGVRTLIPQVLHADGSPEAEIALEFRVDRVFDGKVHFELTDGLRVFHAFTEPYARPAEMVTKRFKAGSLLEALPPQVRSLELRVLEACEEEAHV
jgi:NADPH-dependent 2,4-dienoyl-CoA reductase/sulfur reductase-like enzyme